MATRMENARIAAEKEKSLPSRGDRILVVITPLLGRVSLLFTLIFLFSGPLNLLNMRLDSFSALLLNTCLSTAFFFQHSGMVRSSFRRWSARFIGEKYHAALFTIASSILLLLLVVFWQESHVALYSAQGASRILLRVVFVLSLAGFFWGSRSLGRFDAFGLDPIVNSMKGRADLPKRFRIRGPYRWVRHPLYLFCALMIWSCPDLTADRLLFDLLWTAWIVVGSILEERDLAASFGEDYRAYQTKVPMLIPTSIRPCDQV